MRAGLYVSGMRWTLLALLFVSVGCFPGGDEDLPGEVVGHFEAVGLMVEQSCGAAIPAPDPLDLAFELRLEENGRAFYRLPTGAAFAGTASGDEYTFQISQSFMVIEPDQFRGFSGCSVTQRDVFTFALEQPEDSTDDTEAVSEDGTGGAGGSGSVADSVLMTLTGSQSTDITPLSGSDCRPAVAALGGPYLALPCRVEYVLTGNQIE